jgi:hypothetical protein
VLSAKGDSVSEREKMDNKAEKAEALKNDDVEAHKFDKMEKFEKNEEPDVEGHKFDKTEA